MQEVATIARELGLAPAAVQAAVNLLDEGATVPFIARYRKEVTQGLDDTQLRALEERLTYVRELNARREAIVGAIAEQGKLTDQLRAQLNAAGTKTELEDLYLPYKQKRRTKAQIAREAGLEPLALGLWENPELEPVSIAEGYLNTEAGVTSAKEALEGAKQILMERWAEDAELLAQLRAYLHEHGYLVSKVAPGKESEGAKFRDYFEHREPLAKVPSHRLLAMLRGRNESVLQLSLGLKEELEPGQTHPCENLLAARVGVRAGNRPADAFLAEAVRWTFRVKVLTKIETDLMGDARELAEGEAIAVFARNLKALLLAAPAGAKATVGLDPGLRTGVKVAVVSETGRVLDTGAIFPTPPQFKVREAEQALKRWCVAHNVNLIAIGNGTASRETEKFVTDFLKANPEFSIQKVTVSEAGASVYSASELAAKEFPDLDVTVRGAVSIARRLQDPLAELVKIEPKAIGVGQYQHDVSQTRLGRSLDAVVEDCVNAVGVEINTASVPLLARVAGLNSTIAANIVAYRDEHGPFANRKQLLKVSRLGPKAFEQCAGFLRVRGGDNPLDASGVHPESYEVVSAIAADAKRSVDSLIGDSAFLRRVEPKRYVTEQFGLPTVTDILKELEKPGRDPRPEFQTARFADGVEKLSDLEPDMVLEGTVTNVTNFGAFVDIGVHQDGLVHISALSDTFVKDPHTVVSAGQVVKVKVMEVDLERKRIALSMRLGDKPDASEKPAGRPAPGKRPPPQAKPPTNTMAALFEQAQRDNNKRRKE